MNQKEKNIQRREELYKKIKKYRDEISILTNRIAVANYEERQKKINKSTH